MEGGVRGATNTYNANSGVGVIFGAATKALLFIGVRNKYCSICAIKPEMRNLTIATVIGLVVHAAWRQTSFLKGFSNQHGLRYLWLIGDGDSSIYHSIVTGVPSYGRDITKVECANHAVKCYRNRLKVLCNDKPDYRCKHRLSQAMMKQITHGARCAIRMHSATGDVAALRRDLRNGPRHYFGLHDNCNSAFCQHKSTLSSGKVNTYNYYCI